MVSGPANTENLCSLVKALYENALFYQQSYFEILLISNIIVLIPEQSQPDLLTKHFQVSRPAPRHTFQVPAEPCAPWVRICGRRRLSGATAPHWWCGGWPCPKPPSCSEPSPAHNPVTSFAPASSQAEAPQGRDGSRGRMDPGCEVSGVFIPAFCSFQLTYR